MPFLNLISAPLRIRVGITVCDRGYVHLSTLVLCHSHESGNPVSHYSIISRILRIWTSSLRNQGTILNGCSPQSTLFIAAGYPSGAWVGRTMRLIYSIPTKNPCRLRRGSSRNGFLLKHIFEEAHGQE